MKNNDIRKSEADFMVLSPQLSQAFQALPAAVRILDYSFHYEHQVPPFYGPGQLIPTGHVRMPEGARLQKFGVDDKSARFPVQELDAVA